MRLRLLRQRDESLDVTVANQVGFAAFLEPLGGEIANRLEHQKAWFVEVGKAPKQALVGQLIERLDDVAADARPRATDRLQLFQVATPGENRDAGEQAPTADLEHVVAPE